MTKIRHEIFSGRRDCRSYMRAFRSRGEYTRCSPATKSMLISPPASYILTRIIWKRMLPAPRHALIGFRWNRNNATGCFEDTTEGVDLSCGRWLPRQCRLQPTIPSPGHEGNEVITDITGLISPFYPAAITFVIVLGRDMVAIAESTCRLLLLFAGIRKPWLYRFSWWLLSRRCRISLDKHECFIRRAAAILFAW